MGITDDGVQETQPKIWYLDMFEYFKLKESEKTAEAGKSP